MGGGRERGREGGREREGERGGERERVKRREGGRVGEVRNIMKGKELRIWNAVREWGSIYFYSLMFRVPCPV